MLEECKICGAVIDGDDSYENGLCDTCFERTSVGLAETMWRDLDRPSGQRLRYADDLEDEDDDLEGSALNLDQDAGLDGILDEAVAYEKVGSSSEDEDEDDWEETNEVLLVVISYQDHLTGILGPTQIRLIFSETDGFGSYSLSNFGKPLMSFDFNAEEEDLDGMILKIARSTIRMKAFADRAGLELVGIIEVDQFLAEIARERVLRSST